MLVGIKRTNRELWKMRCLYCGVEIPEGLAYCPACGKWNIRIIVMKEIVRILKLLIGKEAGLRNGIAKNTKRDWKRN